MPSPRSPTVRRRSRRRFAAATDRIGVLVIGRDHGRATGNDQVREQSQLGREIIFQRRMIIEMVAAEIGEGAGRDPHPVEPALVEAVRGRFHGEVGHAFAGELIERACSATGSGVVSEP
jgi:hypothetical protein